MNDLKQKCRIVQCSIRNVRGITEMNLTELDEHFNIISGKNGHGKSSVLDAIMFCLQGWADSKGATGSTLSKDVNLCNHNAKKLGAALYLDNGVYVSRAGEKHKNTSFLELKNYTLDEKGEPHFTPFMHNGEILDTNAKCEAWLREFLGNGSLDVLKFMHASTDTQKAILMRTLGLEEELEAFNERYVAINEEYKKASDRLASLEKLRDECNKEAQKNAELQKVDINELIEKQNNLTNQEREINDARTALKTIEEAIAKNNEEFKSKTEELAVMRAEYSGLDTTLASDKQTLDNKKEAIAKEAKRLDEELEAEILRLKTKREADAKRQADEAEALVAEAKRLDEKLVADKAKLIEKSGKIKAEQARLEKVNLEKEDEKEKFTELANKPLDDIIAAKAKVAEEIDGADKNNELFTICQSNYEQARKYDKEAAEAYLELNGEPEVAEVVDASGNIVTPAAMAILGIKGRREENNTNFAKLLAKSAEQIDGLTIAMTPHGQYVRLDYMIGDLSLASLSASQKINFGMRLLIAQNPLCRTALIYDGSLLDDDTKAIFAQAAIENDFQMIMEIVAEEAPTNAEHKTMFICEGELVGEKEPEGTTLL